MIISASRRTDIPAFYSEWLMGRLRAGYVNTRNPMNPRQEKRVGLSPESVDCIVFWSKDPAPLIKYLDEIDSMGYDYYFQFTLTPYGRDVEEGVRDKAEIAETFKALSERVGKYRVVWRYDPILISGLYDADHHVRAFARLCGELRGYTEKAVISFVDGYRKINPAMKLYGLRAPDADENMYIAREFAGIAAEHGLTIETCAEKADLSAFGIGRARCVDGALIERITGRILRDKYKKGVERENCGCMPSSDIGAYDTCVHGCAYCYANASLERARSNRSGHDPRAEFLRPY